MKTIIIMVFFTLLAGCSSDGITWSSPQVHGDDRSQSERYRDCMSNAKNSEKREVQSRCHRRSTSPDPDYKRVSFPISF